MKRLLCSSILVLSVAFGLIAQTKSQKETTNALPEPKGGMEAFHKFVEANMIYPKESENNGTDGTVYLLVEVSKSGKINSVVVQEGINTEIDQEAIRLLQLSEKQLGWTPGRKGGKNATLKQVVPVRFRIEEVVEYTIPVMDVTMVDDFVVQEIPVQGPQNSNNQVQEIFDIVEEEAQPVGGMAALYESLASNLKYPAQAVKMGIEGTAYVRFIISEKGEVTSAEIIEGREIGYGIDEEAVRLIKETKWVPGKQRGRAISQRKILPVKFKLPKKE